MMNFIKLNRNEKKILIVGFLGSIIARGILLFSLGYAIDDYSFMHIPADFNFGFAQGRWGAGIFNQFMGYFGVQSIYASTLFVFLSFLILAYIGVLICRIWNISNNTTLAFLVVLIFITHPYQAEIYTFKIANAGFAFPMLFAFLALYLVEYNKKSIFLNGLLFAYSLSMYQIVLNYVAVVFVFSVILSYLNSDSSVLSKIKKIFLNSFNKARFLTIFVGIIIYFVLNKAIFYLFDVNIVERGQFLNIENGDILFKRICDIKDAIFNIYLRDELIIPISLKIILLFFLTLAIYGVFLYLYDGKRKVNSLLNIIVFLILITLFSVSFFIPLFVLKNWWPVPRVLASVSLFWSGVVVLSYNYCDFKYKDIIFIILGSLLIVGFIASNNHIYLDQIRINKFDENKANRIISRIEMDVDFSRVKTIAIIGGNWGYLAPTKTVVGDMNISAFGAQWSKIPLLNEISGYNFSEPSLEQFLFSSEYCKKSPRWPLNDSIKIIEDLGIVCL